VAQQLSDVVVHVGRPLGSEERQRVEQALGAQPGISGVRGSPRAGQLFVIDFDPRAISVLGVLRCFDALGLQARLVAM
jgi:hypothetical protein